ncbi:hypothetical protein EXIGLDRAFT_234778 [Exidia glandulosa HHB12029]|uniref:Uncharacterized protein n=1 Tax=Exidia glandulosa HHB12029 TaxID=1314781 RepID=A0A165ML11_EXIGL|nr:hypothetical protein EXIGLDRAFT_234778 [Exidia glandulosa HHB12029]
MGGKRPDAVYVVEFDGEDERGEADAWRDKDGFCATAISTNRRNAAIRTRCEMAVTEVVEQVFQSLRKVKMGGTEASGEMSSSRGERRANSGRLETRPRTASERSEVVIDAQSHGAVKMGVVEARKGGVVGERGNAGKSSSRCDVRGRSADVRGCQRGIQRRRVRGRSPIERARRG